jgi:multidrug efflux pump subunit AcrB
MSKTSNKANKPNKLTVWQKTGLFFYSRYRYTTLLWLVLVGFGVFSYTTWISREGFPSINVPIGIVQVKVFDESAHKVDEVYAKTVVESAVENESVKTAVATSTQAGSTVFLTFEDGTDVESALRDIKDDAKSGISSTSEAEIEYTKLNVGKFTTEGDDLLISVHSSDLAGAELESIAQEVVKQLEGSSPLIERVTVVSQSQTAVNQNTGESQTQQTSFDRFYSSETGQVQNSTLVAVKSVDGTDQLDLYDTVYEKLSSIQLSNDSVETSISASFAKDIRTQISSLQTNLFEGLLIVLVVSFVLISLRASIITAVAMATTVLLTVGTLYVIGFSLNTITLFSLILCLALIVDDTTIMVESIEAGLADKKRKLHDVISDSLKKVARASSTGTIVTILAFAPMLFITGILGEFIRAIPITIIISLVISLLVSIIFIPVMMRISLKIRNNREERKFKLVDKTEKKIGSKLGSLLVWSGNGSKKRSILMRMSAVLVGTTFFVAGIFIFTKVGFNIFPSPKDGNEIIISAQVRDRQNANITDTEEYADQVLEITKNTIGENIEQITLGGQAGPPTRDSFSADVRVVSFKKRDTTSLQYVEKLNEAFKPLQEDLRIKATVAGPAGPASVFTVRINGESNENNNLRVLAQEVAEYLESAELERTDGTTAGFKEVRVSPDIIVLRSNDSEFIEVSAEFTDDDTSTLVNLAKDNIKSEFSDDYLAENGFPASTITFDIGQEQENQDSFSSMGKAFIPLVLAMVLIMAVLFRSLLQPFLILTALPFAVFGVAVGLYTTNNEISFFSMLGVFALIGISLNNTILLTDYANVARNRGLKSTEAMAEALKARLRPLLTTSITSVLALLPLALADPFWEGLAFTLIFGLISSTFLVILVYPYYYLIAEWLRDSTSRKGRKARKAAKLQKKHA